MNNTFLAPGETFSLNDVVGERSRANGFTEGFVINGGRLREDLGGGVEVRQRRLNVCLRGWKDVEQKPYRPPSTVTLFGAKGAVAADGRPGSSPTRCRTAC